MIDCRLIQNRKGEVWKFTGDTLPKGWHWYTEAVRAYVRIAGTYEPPRPVAIEVEKVETGEVRVPCAVISRVVGYLTDTRGWHVGKKQEFRERQNYSVAKAVAHASQTT
jgi:hypothetical protein